MPLRYFENQYDDLSQGQDIEIDYRLWKTRIREIVENILRKEASFPAQKGRQEETSISFFYRETLLRGNIIFTKTEIFSGKLKYFLYLQMAACTLVRPDWPTCCGTSRPGSLR